MAEEYRLRTYFITYNEKLLFLILLFVCTCWRNWADRNRGNSNLFTIELDDRISPAYTCMTRQFQNLVCLYTIWQAISKTNYYPGFSIKFSKNIQQIKGKLFVFFPRRWGYGKSLLFISWRQGMFQSETNRSFWVWSDASDIFKWQTFEKLAVCEK